MIRKLILTFLYLFLPLASIALAFRGLEHYLTEPFNPAQTQTTLFSVAEHKSLREIAKELEQQHLIRSSWSLRIIARIQSKDTSIKAGEYQLSAAMSAEQILDKMVNGEMVLHRVTIKEGARVSEIGPLLEQSGIISQLLFDQALQNQALLSELGIQANSFEGYLFPETYQFPRNTPANKVITTMHEQFNKAWQAEWAQQAVTLKMSKHEILTLASIIEKESGNFEEQPIISSVFHNRLNRNMRLQADPTVIYGIVNFNGNITKNDLQRFTPYNTYLIRGLPPGPIANPGISAIKAALYPAQTNYLYFVGNGAGRHIFSEDLDQHNNAVNKFQRGDNDTDTDTPPAETTPIFP